MTAAVTPSTPAGVDVGVTWPRRSLPTGPVATGPIEASGQPRDAARLLVARRGDGALSHHRLWDLPEVLDAGDVLVVNTSAVLPAALPARAADGTPLRLHLATRDPDGDVRALRRCAPAGADWIVELRRPRGLGSEPHLHARAGQVLALPDGGRARLRASAAAGPGGVGTRLWRATLALPRPLPAYLDAHGAPIRYADAQRAWPLETYQTVFARHPGSAESPSAARGFTPALVARLVAAGVDLAPVVLHTGVSSQEAGEPPAAEWHHVPAATAARVNAARRVVAVGTTAARALETAAGPDGTVRPSEGWTDLVVTPQRGLRVVDGLLTGWHEPEASHLALLEAVAGPELVAASYAAAAEAGYRWHELGDAHLVLP
ncbi:MAG TPA: S-adenosylmethionine:tRNA ribosyltransferase-isomerase [Egibacteraceae bacterium]|nr:S-adenosylmethionine:tRNA ribosyltransferase-isomerase [Egibacteraceae bacterium]